VKNGLEIVPVSRMDQVLQHALVRLPTPIVWEEDLKAAAASKAVGEDEAAAGLVAH
jgi:ATP-dependent Lon protease